MPVITTATGARATARTTPVVLRWLAVILTTSTETGMGLAASSDRGPTEAHLGGAQVAPRRSGTAPLRFIQQPEAGCLDALPLE